MTELFKHGIGRRELALGTGAALVGYVTKGIGAIESDIQSALGYLPSVSVLQFMQPAEIFAVQTGTYGQITSIHGAINAAFAAAIEVNFPQGDYRTTETVQMNHWNRAVGVGMSKTLFTKIGDTFAFDIYVLGSSFNTGEISGMQITAKNGISIRFLPGINYIKNANPTRATYFHDLRLIGTYDSITDASAGTATIFTRTDLEPLGIGINSVMNYGAKRERVYFSKFGIALCTVGDTLTETTNCRFADNARHIHDERTAWYGSGFGMGADNKYTLNDILDGRRHGSVWMEKSYGTKFQQNYLENLDRSGAVSSATMLLQNNTARVHVTENHLNASLSYTKSQPFYVCNTSRAAVSDSGGNVTTNNYLTPFANVNDTTVSLGLGFNYLYPEQLLYENNLNWPKTTKANVNLETPKLDRLTANNIVASHKFGGLNVMNEDLWITNGTGGYFLKTDATSVQFWLEVTNPNLNYKFALILDVDDNATGNGRVFATIKDSDGISILWNAYLFQGVTAPGQRQVVITSALLESFKKMHIDLRSLSECKVYGVRLEPLRTIYQTTMGLSPASIAPGASSTVSTIAVAGAELGDSVKVDFSLDLQGIVIMAWVSAEDTVKIYFHNPTGNTNGTVDIATGVVYIAVTKRIK